MNKQEALETILNIMKYYQGSNENVEAVKVIKELVDKATQKKPEWGRTELGCGNCDSTRIIEIITERKNKFCPDCGVEIDWTKTSLIGEGEQK